METSSHQTLVDAMAEAFLNAKQAHERAKEVLSRAEDLIAKEFDELSTPITWASEMHGIGYILTRSSKNIIEADDLRMALGEYIEPSELDKLIRPERDRIVSEPARVMLTEVNKLKKQGGLIAEQIEKITEKQTKTINVKKKEVSNDN